VEKEQPLDWIRVAENAAGGALALPVGILCLWIYYRSQKQKLDRDQIPIDKERAEATLDHQRNVAAEWQKIADANERRAIQIEQQCRENEAKLEGKIDKLREEVSELRISGAVRQARLDQLESVAPVHVRVVIPTQTDQPKPQHDNQLPPGTS
jgi:hypothetical protein